MINKYYSIKDFTLIFGKSNIYIRDALKRTNCKSIRRNCYTEEHKKTIEHYIKRIELKKKLIEERKKQIQIVYVDRIKKEAEIIEVPKFITKEITYHIYESKLNFFTLEQL